MARSAPPVFLLIAVCCIGGSRSAPYVGKLIGKLSELHHGVSGEVYAVDGRTLYIKDFTYDGQGPGAYFYASTKTADKSGFRLRDETGSGDVIRRYRKEGVTLTLPEGKTLNNIKIFYVWCEDFDVNFGDVKIPRNFDYPRPQKIAALKGVHSISSDNIVIVDAQTLLIPNLSYDGEAPDAKFWVGRGPKPSPQGIRVPDENGKEAPLRRYEGKTVVLTLPGDLTVFDVGHFGIWCEQFTVDFGHVVIPEGLDVPPSLKMLGVSPQSKLNCEVLSEALSFEVRWAVAGESIVVQLVAKLDDGEYMSFGPSGEETNSVMIGGDVVVAWVDKETLKGYAVDYYLADKSQCSGPSGSCPDVRLQSDTDTIRLLNAATVNGFSIVTYQRPLKASDQYDRPVLTNRSQAIIWGVGPRNQRDEVSFHTRYLKKNALIDFGRPARWNCPMPENDQPPMAPGQIPSPLKPNESEDSDEYEAPVEVTTKRTNGRRRVNNNRGSSRPQEDNYDDSDKSASGNKDQSQAQTTKRRIIQKGVSTQAVPPPTPVKKREAWEIPPIQCFEPEDGVFYAQMGPTGGKRGYPAITGHVGWGISWYINGLLIPEINVVRGKSYTFVVEGGLDPEVSAKYHPFYITDDPVGGFAYKKPEERENIRIFAGVRTAKDGSPEPTGTGRLCHWTQTGDLEADDFQSFGAYQRTLELKCDHGEPGVIQWTPDKNTPDTVYYQCYTHRHLGWKINVHDTCDNEPAGSELKLSIVPAPSNLQDKFDTDLESSPSIQIETRVKPNEIIKEDKEDLESKSAFSENKVEQTSPNHSPKLPNEPSQIQKINSSPYRVDIMHYSEKNYHQFRPSTPTDIVENTSTTEKPSSTPRLTDNLAIASSHTNNTYLVPPKKILSQNLNRRPTYHNHLKPQMQSLIMRRPLNPYPQRNFGYPKNTYKKYLMGTPIKLPLMNSRPLYINHSPSVFAKTPPIRTQMMTGVKNVEITPEQPSTEREPEIQTALSSPTNLHQAYNTGFKPGSIKIESGFKPIITKGFQDRIDKEDLEIQDEGETGVVNIDSENKFEYKPSIAFEPMFVPSPTFKPAKEKRLKVHKRPVATKKHDQYVKIILKRSRSFEEPEPIDEEGSRSFDEQEPIAEAAENVESYYLPPPNSPPVDVIRQPSSIDIEFPMVDGSVDTAPDVVVTYDGKRVSGHSLTAKLSDRPSLDSRLSKASAFITARPQFGQFRGELPPLNIDFIHKNAPQLQASVGSLSRELNTPSLPDESGASQGSTRLSRVQRYESGGRSRRQAHHTQEHTAQQEKEARDDESGAGGHFVSFGACLGAMLFGFLPKYLIFS